MRKNNRNNRWKTGAGATGPATRKDKRVYTAGQQDIMHQGLRILARMIVRSQLRRVAPRSEPAPHEPPSCDRPAG